jgi:hypothetical protein
VAVAEATVFMNPRRFVVVLLSRISFDIDSTEVFDETTSCIIDDVDDGATKAYDDGARTARAANAAERKVVLIMVA